MYFDCIFASVSDDDSEALTYSRDVFCI